MKNQALFSSKDKSKKLKCRLLQFCLVLYGLNAWRTKRSQWLPEDQGNIIGEKLGSATNFKYIGSIV